MNIAIPFRPKLFETLKKYSLEQFRRDFGAGLNVMVMAFPLSVAFAIASGAKQEPDILILRVRKVLAMDATGLQALEDLRAKLRAKGKHLILSAAHTQPLMVMENAGFLDRLGRENVCPHIAASLAPAREILGLPAEPETDPLHQERKKMDAVRRELTGTLERANEVLQTPAPGNRGFSLTQPITTLGNGNGKPNNGNGKPKS